MSETILALDTTREFGSVALLRGGETVEEVLLHSPEGFGGILYEHLRRLFDRHAVRVPDVDCFAAASGPGSFTGVRIGLACVKGLGEAAGKPVAAVSSLCAIASFGTAPLRAPLADARRGEIYGALYDASGNLVRAETVGRFSAWLSELPDAEVEFLSPDIEPFRAALAASRFAACPLTPVPRALAAAVGRIALARYREGRAGDPAAVDANYVRRSDAELLWKDR